MKLEWPTWRLKKIFDEFGVAASMVLNGSVCDTYPQIVGAGLASGWDLVGHGWVQRALPAVPDQNHRAGARERSSDD